jgi:ribonuclease Z
MRVRLNRITFLGTSSGAPQCDRNVSGIAITTEAGGGFLVDCGEGTQRQLLQCSPFPWSTGYPDVIFITHLHGDHCFGLFGLLASLGLRMGSGPSQTAPPTVKVVGPTGIKELVETVFRFSGTHLPYDLTFMELGDDIPKKGVLLGKFLGIDVFAYPLTHRVPTFGYRFAEPSRRGVFDPDKARSLGVTDKNLFKNLTAGVDVLIGDTMVKSSDVLGPPQPGNSILICQDTCDSDNIVGEIDRCTILIHEATYREELREKAVEWGHSTAKMAAEFAKKVRADVLFLTHFSSRYDDQDVEDLVREAESVQGSIGRVIFAAKDFMQVNLLKNHSVGIQSAKKAVVL